MNGLMFKMQDDPRITKVGKFIRKTRCGNVLHVHDLVDFVSEEAGNAGRNAALYVNNNGEDKIPEEIKITLSPQNGVRYTVPSEIRIGHMAEEDVYKRQLIFFVHFVYFIS